MFAHIYVRGNLKERSDMSLAKCLSACVCAGEGGEGDVDGASRID